MYPEEKWKTRKVLEAIITPPEIRSAHHVRHFWETAVIGSQGKKKKYPHKETGAAGSTHLWQKQ